MDTKLKIEVEYWEPKDAWVTSSDGFTYLDRNSECKQKTFIEGTKDEIFSEFYKRNNSLRYCNGSYWKFVDSDIEKEYRKDFFPKHNTISNYYGNGVVD